MASNSSVFFAFLFLSFFFLSVTTAQPSSSSRPGGLFFPVRRDLPTLKYVTRINLGKVPVDVVIDLGGKSSWIYSAGGCAYTTITGAVTAQSNDFINDEWVSGPNVTATGISLRCETNPSLLRGLPKGVNGVVGLGRSDSGLSLTSQFSAAFRFPQKFAFKLYVNIELSSRGALYFGGGPYFNIDTSLDYPSQPLVYTPLLTNSYFPSDYFVDVQAIDINLELVTLNQGLLAINKKNGMGGTKFSTWIPYTTMESSIYKAFTSLYIANIKVMGISMVAPVSPFSVCMNGSTIDMRPESWRLPAINFRLAGGANWYLPDETNTLERVADDVYCLAFVDGGSKRKTSIVFGGIQMESFAMEFDLPKSRLGFTIPVQF